MKWSIRKNPTVAIAGCTGAVGRELIRLIDERRPAFGEVHLLASQSSAGTKRTVLGKDTEVHGLHGYDFSSTDIAFFAVGAETSVGHVPRAAEQGCLVIDKSSAFRMRPEIPLVVPQVNADAIAQRPDSGIIASPNCSTIPLVRALAPVHAAIGVQNVIVSTYQAASGVGLACIDDLLEDSSACLDGDTGERPSRFPRPLAFNVVPQIDVFESDGFTQEERKLVFESRKILGDPKLSVTATTVRVPVVNVHSEAVYVQCKRAVSREEIIAALRTAPDVIVADEIDAYETPRFNPDPNAVSVGRVRLNPDDASGVWMWIVADNLRPGAALNALQIAELAMQLSNSR